MKGLAPRTLTDAGFNRSSTPRQIAEATGLSVEQVLQRTGAREVDEVVPAVSLQRHFAFPDSFSVEPPQGLHQAGRAAQGLAGGGNAGLLRLALDQRLEQAAVGQGGGPQPTTDQPDIYTVGNPLATWVDQNLGNGDGVLSASELQTFVNRHGNDPSQHQNIASLANQLGYATVQLGNQIQILGLTPGTQPPRLSVSVSIGGVTSNVSTSSGHASAAHTTATLYTPAHGNRDDECMQLLGKLVYLYGGATRAHGDAAFAKLLSCPTVVLRHLVRSGYQIKVCTNVCEVRPELRNFQPRGFAPHQDWSAAAGLHSKDRREIIVVARAGIYGAELANPNGVMHEIGHAVDHLNGDASRRHPFATMRSHDVERMRRMGHHYQLQPGDAGLEETYAESFAWFCHERGWMEVALPNLYRYWADQEASDFGLEQP